MFEGPAAAGVGCAGGGAPFHPARAREPGGPAVLGEAKAAVVVEPEADTDRAWWCCFARSMDPIDTVLVAGDERGKFVVVVDDDCCCCC